MAARIDYFLGQRLRQHRQRETEEGVSAPAILVGLPGFQYMARRATIFDQALVDFAKEREKRLSKAGFVMDRRPAKTETSNTPNAAQMAESVTTRTTEAPPVGRTSAPAGGPTSIPKVVEAPQPARAGVAGSHDKTLATDTPRPAGGTRLHREGAVEAIPHPICPAGHDDDSASRRGSSGVRETSLEAYRRLRTSGKLSAQQLAIVAHFCKAPGVRATRQELARDLVLGINCITGRVHELTTAEPPILVENGRKKCAVTGNEVGALELAP